MKGVGMSRVMAARSPLPPHRGDHYKVIREPSPEKSSLLSAFNLVPNNHHHHHGNHGNHETEKKKEDIPLNHQRTKSDDGGCDAIPPVAITTTRPDHVPLTKVRSLCPSDFLFVSVLY
eukprot:sb/3476431/